MRPTYENPQQMVYVYSITLMEHQHTQIMHLLINYIVYDPLRTSH